MQEIKQSREQEVLMSVACQSEEGQQLLMYKDRCELGKHWIFFRSIRFVRKLWGIPFLRASGIQIDYIDSMGELQELKLFFEREASWEEPSRALSMLEVLLSEYRKSNLRMSE